MTGQPKKKLGDSVGGQPPATPVDRRRGLVMAAGSGRGTAARCSRPPRACCSCWPRPRAT